MVHKKKKAASRSKAETTKVRRMTIIDVPSTATDPDVVDKSKVLTFPCADCGQETNPSNRSILQSGKTVHIGCPKKGLTPRDVERKAPVVSGLPKHKGVKVPVRPPPPVSKKYGDIVVMCDYAGRTCIQVKRDVTTVTYIPLDVSGFHLTYEQVNKFDERFKPLVDYPIEKACEHYVRYSVEYGATQDVLDYLGRVVTITEEQAIMAKSKLAGKSTTEVVVDGKKVKVPGKAKGGGERKDSASAMFQTLIMEGKHTDDEIFKRVAEKFGLDEKKRAYVAWYRNHLRKQGKNPPDAKGGKKDDAPAKAVKKPAEKKAGKKAAKK